MRYNIDAIKAAARGQWASIISRDIDGKFLTGKHGPCPKCGGTDRWRVYRDFADTGGGICGRCNRNIADGIAMLAWWRGCSIRDVIKDLANEFGIEPEKTWTPSAQKQKWKLYGPVTDTHAQMFVTVEEMRDGTKVRSNAGIKPSTLFEAGACHGDLSGEPVIAFPVYDADGLPNGNYCCMSSGKSRLTDYSTKPARQNALRKKTLAGGKSGLLGADAVTQLSHNAGAVERVYKTEGVTDMLAMMGMIPADKVGSWIVVSNSAGASEDPKWMAGMISKAPWVKVIGDRDKSQVGEMSARGWAQLVKNENPDCEVSWSAHFSSRDDIQSSDVREYVASHVHDLDFAQQFLLEAGTEVEVDKSFEWSHVAGSGSQGKATQPGKDSGDVAGIDKLSLEECHEFLRDEFGIEVVREEENGTIHLHSIKMGKSSTVRDISKLSQVRIVQIGGVDLQDKFGSGTGQYSIGQLKLAIAGAASVMRSDDDLRGAGVWRDLGADGEWRGRMVLCNANSLSLWDGKNLERAPGARVGTIGYELGSGRDWFDHGLLSECLESARAAKWRTEVFSRLHGIVDRWTWGREHDSLLVAALIVATWVQEVWEYRPVVSIRGHAGAGKTVFADSLFGPGGLFGDLAFLSSLSTAAGMRQSIGHRMKCVALDEFDSLSSKAKEEIMGLLKLAWAGGVKTIGATSGTNRGVKFQVQHLFWLLGIHVGSIDDAFSSRALEFELQKIPGSEKWTNFRAPSPSEMSTLQTQTLAVALHCCQEARIAASKLSADKTGSEHVHDRTRVSLATCAALIAAIDGQGEQVAKDLIVRWAAERITDQADQTKSEDVLDSILDLTIPVGHGGQVSAATILRGDRDDYSDAIDQLETQIGIKWVNGNHGKYLAVNCKRTFAHLPKSLNINNSRALSQVLLSLCRGVRPKVTHIAGAKRQCVQIPAEVVNSSLFDN